MSNKHMTDVVILVGVAMTNLLLTTTLIHAEVIFFDDFSGTSADLNGAEPDVRPGTETWVAAPYFNQDGSLDGSRGSATLEFTPTDGNLYQLDVSLKGLDADEGDKNWIALGFANGQSAGTGTSDRFITGNVIGTAWMFIRGDASEFPNRAWLGYGTGPNGGTGDGVDMSAFTNENPGGDMDLRIVLDTTAGAGTWTATWLAKRAIEENYTEVRPETLMLTETMNSIGVALAGGTVTGTIQSFSLQTIVLFDPDLNTDNYVDDKDLNLLLSDFNPAGSGLEGGPPYTPDQLDVLLEEFGTGPAASSAVPEPASIVLLLFGVVGLSCFRRNK